MGFMKVDDSKFVKIETELKLLREDNERMRSTLQTLTKHIKFLVHMVKVVNPELKEPAE